MTSEVRGIDEPTASGAVVCAQTPDTKTAPTEPPARRAKTAVVLVHGMGEQRPMATLWGFVDAVWSADRDLVTAYDAPIYAKPDTINDSVDLRRVTTRYWDGEQPRRVDFFEYYWAHLMRGNTVRSTIDWILGLFIRRPSSVPGGLRRVWALGLLFLLAAIALFAAAALPKAISELLFDKRVIVALGIASTVGGLAAARWLAPVAGDAARYFSPDPDNVEARQKIIRGGVDVIEKLTRSGEYDRIILVGHSLGTAIGLDILNQAFGRVLPDQWAGVHQPGGAGARALLELEKLAGQLGPGAASDVPSDAAFTAFRDAQRDYAAALSLGWQTGAAPWLVSDFVTLGSPLSKANVLIARTESAFRLLAERRQVPTCPPKLEQKTPPRFSFAARGGARVPHYGAVFAPTAWTNIWFPTRAFVFGDIISGPVRPLLGAGVRDVRMPSTGFRFRHLDYWRAPDAGSPWILSLRNAVNLRLRRDAQLWEGPDPVPPVSVARIEHAAPPPPGLVEPGSAGAISGGAS